MCTVASDHCTKGVSECFALAAPTAPLCCSRLTASQRDAAEMIPSLLLSVIWNQDILCTCRALIRWFHLWGGHWNQSQELQCLWETGRSSWPSCSWSWWRATTWAWKPAAPPGLVAASDSLGLEQAFKAVPLLHLGQPGDSHSIWNCYVFAHFVETSNKKSSINILYLPGCTTLQDVLPNSLVALSLATAGKWFVIENCNFF